MGYVVNIRWEPLESYTTELPYLPRVGDMLQIFDENDDEVVCNKVTKVVYFENIDTRQYNEPNFDIYIDRKTPPDDMPIDEFCDIIQSNGGDNVRIYNAFNKCNFKNVGDVRNYMETNDLTSILRLGEKSKQSILKALNKNK